MCRQICEVELILWDEESEIGYLVYVDDKVNLEEEKDTGLSAEDWLAAKALYEENYERILSMYNEMVTVFSLDKYSFCIEYGVNNTINKTPCYLARRFVVTIYDTSLPTPRV